jgi:hypothetical protein
LAAAVEERTTLVQLFQEEFLIIQQEDNLEKMEVLEAVEEEAGEAHILEAVEEVLALMEQTLEAVAAHQEERELLVKDFQGVLAEAEHQEDQGVLV